MDIYYEVKALNRHDGDTEVLFGSYDRIDCKHEMDAERVAWKADYKQIKIVARDEEED